MTATLRLLWLILFASLAAMTAATAQSIGPDEAVGSHGSVSQPVVLTPAQRRAIYSAIMRQKGSTADHGIAAIVGAPVPPSATLRDLPRQAMGTRDPFAEDSGIAVLKYATVEDDVIIVDPMQMRVVDVIHGGATP